uniref:F-box domain-containing protein n=1 Tax=Graphocephala atropunctata TaxID=36148 RepID=A0A1B6M5K0_9HEMI
MEPMTIEDNPRTCLENLPIEVIEIMAQFLSTKDMAACCAVSRRMRIVFGDDALWRRHCDRDQQLAEYLRITPCKVEPVFVSPETEHSTLSPVCHWRLAFMRENRLWNNWRLDKCKVEGIKDSQDSGYICSVFLSNDVVVVMFRDRIKLLDVGTYPAIEITTPIRFGELVTYPMEFYGNFQETREQFSRLEWDDNRFVTICIKLVQVYEVDLEKKLCILKHKFNFTGSQTLAKDSAGNERVLKMAGNNRPNCGYIYVLSGKYFVGSMYYTGIVPIIIHVWNIRTGEKLATAECPVIEGTEGLYKMYSTGSACIVLHLKRGNYSHSFLSYSLENLCFLPFRKTITDENFRYVNNCSMNLISIQCCSVIYIFNCKTGEQLLKEFTFTDELGFHVKDKLLFNHYGESLMMFNPETRDLSTVKFSPDLRLPGSQLAVTCDRFLWLGHPINEMWEKNGGNFAQANRRASKCKHMFSERVFPNKNWTRIISKEKGDYILHYW